MSARSNDTAQLAALSSPLTGDSRKPMAKAHLRNPEIVDWPKQIGKAVRLTRGALSLKEFAAAIGRDERQIARWEEGKENPQLASIFAVRDFRLPLIEAIARLSDDVEIVTTISIRRSA